MTIITAPATMKFALGSGITQRPYGMLNESQVTGASQWQQTGESRWILTIAAPRLMRADEAGVWRSMLLRLRGRANHLACWDPSRPAPAGTARGAMSFGGAAQGATTAAISGGNGTLKAGDWLQIGAVGLASYQLVCVVSDTVVPGNVTFEPPLRRAFAGGTAVTWSMASALFKLQGDVPDFLAGASAGQIQGFKATFLEQWT
jgi:hypothetical protein